MRANKTNNKFRKTFDITKYREKVKKGLINNNNKKSVKDSYYGGSKVNSRFASIMS